MSDRQPSSLEVIPHEQTASLQEQYDITTYEKSKGNGVGIPKLDAAMDTLLGAYQTCGQLGAVRREQLEVALEAQHCVSYRTGMGLEMSSIDTLASEGLLDHATIEDTKVILPTKLLMDRYRVNRRD